MKINSTVKALLGAVALAVAGSAMATTTLSTVSPGSIVLNVVDTTNNTSFLFDTGLTTSSFNGGSHYQFNVADANWTSFLAGRGASTDEIAFDVIGVVAPTVTSGTRQAFTTSGADFTVSNFSLTQAATTGRNYFNAVNASPSGTANSEYSGATASDAAKYANSQALWSAATNLGVADLTGLDTSIGFYSAVQTGTSSASRTVQAVITKFAGTWNLTSGGNLTYAAVPLPASWTLILSGLALMGIIARRRKSTTGADDYSLSAFAG